MFRVFLISMIFVIVSVFGADEDTYVFEAKGKFAKELKALVEKYSKDGKINVKVMKPSEINRDRSIMGILLNSKTDEGDITLGKKVYDRSCFKCHGKRGDESSYATRLLADMKKEEIIDSLMGYRNDSEFGGDTKMIMNMQVSTLSEKEINSLADYIYSFKHGSKNQKNVENSAYLDGQSSSSDGEVSSYLK